jgi:hypothetical protein
MLVDPLLDFSDLMAGRNSLWQGDSLNQGSAQPSFRLSGYSG